MSFLDEEAVIDPIETEEDFESLTESLESLSEEIKVMSRLSDKDLTQNALTASLEAYSELFEDSPHSMLKLRSKSHVNIALEAFAGDVVNKVKEWFKKFINLIKTLFNKAKAFFKDLKNKGKVEEKSDVVEEVRKTTELWDANVAQMYADELAALYNDLTTSRDVKLGMWMAFWYAPTESKTGPLTEDQRAPATYSGLREVIDYVSVKGQQTLREKFKQIKNAAESGSLSEETLGFCTTPLGIDDRKDIKAFLAKLDEEFSTNPKNLGQTDFEIMVGQIGISVNLKDVIRKLESDFDKVERMISQLSRENTEAFDNYDKHRQNFSNEDNNQFSKIFTIIMADFQTLHNLVITIRDVVRGAGQCVNYLFVSAETAFENVLKKIEADENSELNESGEKYVKLIKEKIAAAK